MRGIVGRLLAAVLAFCLIAQPVAASTSETLSSAGGRDALASQAPSPVFGGGLRNLEDMGFAPISAKPRLQLAQLLLGVTNSAAASSAVYTPLGAAFDAAISLMGPTSTCPIAAFQCPLGGGNSKTLLMSWWQMVYHAQPTGAANTLTKADPSHPFRTITDPAGTTACELGKSVCMAFDNPTTNKMQLNFYDSTGGSGHGFDLAGISGHVVQVDGQWEHWLVGFNTATQHWAIYRNGNLVGPGGAADFSVTSIPANVLIDWSNANRAGTSGDPMGLGIVNANPTSASYTWIADEYINITDGSYVCDAAGSQSFTGFGTLTCSGVNTIPPAVLAKFFNAGAPVNFHTDPNCKDVTGNTPLVCLYGDGANFGVNHGTADSGTGSPATAFAYQPVRTSGTIWKPPYGPAGLPNGVATMVAIQANNTAANCTVAPCTLSIDATKIAAQLQTGDLAIVYGTLQDASAFFTAGQTFACSSPGSTSWTLLTQFQSGTAHKEMGFVCYGNLAANDLAGVYSITWQSGALAQRYHAIALTTYRSPGRTIVVDDAQGKVSNTAVNSQCAPNSTASVGGDTLVSFLSNFSASVSSHALTPPATGMTRLRIESTATPGQLAQVDENATTEGTPLGTGTITGRCWTQQAAATDSYEAFALLLKN